MNMKETTKNRLKTIGWLSILIWGLPFLMFVAATGLIFIVIAWLVAISGALWTGRPLGEWMEKFDL